MTRSRVTFYRRSGTAMLRAAVNLLPPALPEWPLPGSSAGQWRSWLVQVWSDDPFRRAVTAASPDLSRQIEAILNHHVSDPRKARRACLAVARYALRYAYRSTPYGLFAGIAPAQFGGAADVRFGDAHTISRRPDPVWLDSVVHASEAVGELAHDLSVCVNNLVRVRDGRVYVPSEGASEFSLALTPAVALVLEAARSPVGCVALTDKLGVEFPRAGSHCRSAFIAELLRAGLLRSALRAPATVTDPAAVLPDGMDGLGQGPVAVDVRLDADVWLPEAVATEMETAATVLARLAMYPSGTPAWGRYIQRFADRWGEGAEIPLEQLTDPDRGLGLPAGFGFVSEPPRPMSRRDRLLLDLAGTAAVEGKKTLTLSEEVITELEKAAGGPPGTFAPHFELSAQVQARSVQALDKGNFRIRVHAVSRAAGTMTGRFWHLLPDAAAGLDGLPTVRPEAELAQLSFHPTRVAVDLLTRAPQVLPRLVSVGEFRDRGNGALFPSDLVVGLRDGHLYLAEAGTGQPLEILAPTAINFVWNNFTPPLVRFLAEISRAATSQVTWFDWGTAWALPFTPALHYRRSILTAARWQLKARALPPRTASLAQWAESLNAWRARAGVPDRVLLSMDDQRLPLDLTRDMDLDLLRTRLNSSSVVVLHDAAPPDADGWIGGRAHSIVVPLRAAR